MSTVQALVSGACVTNVVSIRIDNLRLKVPQSGQAAPFNNSNRSAASHKRNKDLGIKNLFKQLSSGSDDSFAGVSSVPGPLEEMIMSGVKKVLQRDPLTKALDESTLKNQGIPINKVIASQLESFMKTDDGKEADYATCDVTSDVRDNQLRISVKLNFHNIQNMQFKELNIETVQALATDNSKIIFHEWNRDRNSQNINMTDA